MIDDRDVLNRLTAYHDHIAAPAVPVLDDLRRGRRRVRRNRAVVSGCTAVAVAAVVLAASLLAGGSRDAAPQPAAPTETTSPAPVNGAITGVAQRFGAPVGDYDWRGYDVTTDRALFISEGQCESCFDRAGSLTVVDAKGTVAKLVCGTDLPCGGLNGSSQLVAALGPGPDEVTVALGNRTMRVISFDGRVRRALNMTGALAPTEDIRGLVWRHDGRGLAVVSSETVGRVTFAKVWLVDPRGGARLAYSLMRDFAENRSALPNPDPNDYDAEGSVWSLGGWSPDGSALLLDVLMDSPTLGRGPRVVVLRLQPPGAARPATPQVLYASDRHFDWARSVAWSPDGTRVAVRRENQIVEISSEDGRVLATHRHIDGWLIWPRATAR